MNFEKTNRGETEMNEQQRAATERLRELGPLSKLIYNHNGNLAIATADGTNAMGYFEPMRGDSCEDMMRVIDAFNEALPLIEALAADNERLRKKEGKLKETLFPVCEYAAEIYNRGTPVGEMPADTIQRLNYGFKVFGG